MIAELSVLEKALTKADFAGQKSSLESIWKSLRPLRLSSLEALDLNTRGRLLTTLLRVSRQPKPAAPAEAAPAPEVAEAPTDVVAESVQTPPAELAEGQGISEGDKAEVEQQAEEAQAEKKAEGEQAVAGAGTAAQPKTVGYADVLYQVGAIWRAVGEKDRAEAAFGLSGRTPGAELDAPIPEAPRRERPEGREGREGKGRREGKPGERRERGERGERGERRERPERPERGPRPERPERAERPRRESTPIPVGGDWADQARAAEEAGRTRDAGRIHERNNSFAEAARLFELGGDIRAALKNALAAKDNERAKRLLSTVPPEQAEEVMEKAGAWELLMEHHVEKGNFDQVARLYERARQFDQAALAWERSGKFGPARRAYERAKDLKGAERVRQMEIDKLIERGDRLGAAQLLAQAGQKEKAAETLGSLPPPKTYRFLQKLGLNEQADALAKTELARADTEGKPLARARWLELTGDNAGALAIYEAQNRPDRAVPIYEKQGEVAKAAEIAEKAGLRGKAIELYKKLNDAEGLKRAEALPEPVKPERAAKPEGEEATEPPEA